MFPWRSSQCRHESCEADEEKKPKPKQLLLSAFVLVILLFLLLAGVCSDWMEAEAWFWDQQVACRMEVTEDSSPVPFLQVHFMTEEWERFGICEKGENVHVKERRSHKRARGWILSMEVSLGYRLLKLCCPGRGNTTVKKEKQWFLSGCPFWEEQTILKHGQSRRTLSFPSHL